MRPYLVSAIVALAFTPAAVFGQAAGGLFCTAGIHPDAYVDFTQLPPPPAAVPGQVQGPLTYTLPVTGIAGLTVQVTIPAGPEGQQAYGVGEGQLALPGTNATVQLVFNKPVFGVSAIGNSYGRQSAFSISPDPTTNPDLPPAFLNSIATLNLPLYFYSQPLQQVNVSPTIGGFTNTYIFASAPGYGSVSMSNVRVQSTSTDNTSLVPTNGLQQWLSSDMIVAPFEPGLGTWPDASGNHHDATQTNIANSPAPSQGDGNNCKPAYGFSGNQFFNFNLPIDGWQQMTIFLVAKPYINPPANSFASYSAAIFWVENAYWGNTFVSPYQTSENFRFGTKQVNNEPIYTRPATIGQDYTITRAVHNGSTDSLYVNGLLALSQAGKNPVLAGTSGAGFIGMGYNNTGYNGAISEILVYNRVLSSNEAAGVESYLRNKFGTR